MYIHLVASSVLLPLLDNHGLKVLTLSHLGLDIGNQLAEVWCVLWIVSVRCFWFQWRPYVLGLGPLLLGQKAVGHGELPLVSHAMSNPLVLPGSKYLEGSAETEDTVVGLLGTKTLEGGLDGVVLLGEQVIGPVQQFPSAHHSRASSISPQILPSVGGTASSHRGSVPQAELPVARGIAVPVGEGLHPALQPRALHDVGGERRRRHGCGRWTADRGRRDAELPSIAVLTVGGGEVVMRKKRKPIGWPWPGGGPLALVM